MSLIDEALRRAQAAQTADSTARGLRVPMPLPDPSRYRRRQALRVGVVALALALAAAGAWLWWRRGGAGVRESRVTPRLAAPQSPAENVAAGAAPTTAPSATPTATASPAGRASARVAATAIPVASVPEAKAVAAIPPLPTPATRRPADAAATMAIPTSTSRSPTAAIPRDALRRAPPETPIILPPVEVSNASGSPRIAAPGRARPEAPRPEAVPTPEPTLRAKTYTGTATLPSGRLELGGIVYSEGSPTALINGRVVRPGSYVDGYTVVRIEPNRVELKNEIGTIILNLK